MEQDDEDYDFKSTLVRRRVASSRGGLLTKVYQETPTKYTSSVSSLLPSPALYPPSSTPVTLIRCGQPAGQRTRATRAMRPSAMHPMRR